MEIKPVTGPVRSVSLEVFAILAVLLFAAKLTMDFAPSAILKQIAVGVALVSFLLAVAVLLLQVESVSVVASISVGGKERTRESTWIPSACAIAILTSDLLDSHITQGYQGRSL
jgi:Flp pilus assembly protein protease CpaA